MIPSIGRLLAFTALAVTAWATCEAAVEASTPQRLRVSAAQLFNLAEAAEAKGDESSAKKAYHALLADPSSEIRNEARFKLAMLEQQRGSFTDAAMLLRRVIDERPDAVRARLELAKLLDRMGDKDGALREVRAAQSAGLPAAVARLVDRYSEALRAARPMGASFAVAIAPDSNINRATRSDSLGTVIGDFEIDEESKAKSGVGLSLSGQAYRRLTLGDGDLSLLGRVSGFADLYGSRRFNDIALDVAAGPELLAGRNKFTLEAGATQRWFGQEPLSRSLRLGASWTKALGRRSQLRLGATAASVNHRLNDLQDGRSYSGQANFEHSLSPTTGVGLSVAVDRQALKDAGYSTRSWRAGLMGWQDFGRTTVTGELQVGRLRADDRLSLFPERRSEESLRVRIGATFRQLTVGGFAPTARLVFERNRSSIEFYDFKRTRTEIGVVRAF